MVATNGLYLEFFFFTVAISIAEARKILGSDSDRLSDEEIRRILQNLYVLANDLLDLYEDGSL